MSTESSDIRDEEGYNTLIELIGDAPSREWIEMYLDWMKKPLDAVGIHLSDDDRFAMTMSPNPGKRIYQGDLPAGKNNQMHQNRTLKRVS